MDQDAGSAQGMDSQQRGPLMGIALPGWMQREQAVRFFTEDCVFSPPLSGVAAESLWNEWHERAAALPARDAAIERLELTAPEQDYAGKFLDFLKSIGVPGVEVVKVDPLQLVVAQYHIATDRAAEYAGSVATATEWLDVALPTEAHNPHLNINFTRRSLETDIDIELPHAEFLFGVHPHGGFGPRELLPYVGVINVSNRFLLNKGYHRLYARISVTEARHPDRLSLVALDPGTLQRPPGEDSFSAGLDVFGKRPALLADYFTEGLAMPVLLRRKQYRLEVKARLVTSYVPVE